MYLETYVLSTLNVQVQVKSQLLYRQQTYNTYQEFLYGLCEKLHSQGLGYRKISYQLNDWNLKSVRGKVLKNNHVFSIIKKGRIRKERIKNLKGHLDFSTLVQDIYLEFEEL